MSESYPPCPCCVNGSHEKSTAKPETALYYVSDLPLDAPPHHPAPKGTEYLSDYSPKDKPWDTHRTTADVIAQLYADGGEEWERYAKRVWSCAGLLEFQEEVNRETGEVRPKLRRAAFCRVRQCTVCQWRRSLVNKARFIQKLPGVLAAHPGARLIFLTLTVRNCNVTDLKATIKHMNKSFRRMLQRKAWWPALGWVKSIEVTRNKDGSAHPHFHVVLLVPAGYFGGTGYIKQADWTDAWQQALQVDYKPIVDVRAIKRGQEMTIAPELLKYAVKPTDLIADRDWFLEYSREVRAMRFVESGGAFRDVLKDTPDEDEMLHVNEDGEVEEAEEEGETVKFGWNRGVSRYKRLKKRTQTE